jgi:AmpD protein
MIAHGTPASRRGRPRACNDFSIGIELEGTDDRSLRGGTVHDARSPRPALRRVYPIADIVGHSDIAPGRKTDPGPAFDWGRLARLTAPRIG